MTTQTYQQVIIEGIKDLPPARLAEIADFVYFLRNRERQPQKLDDELRAALLHAELRQLSRAEEAHLEDELETSRKESSATSHGCAGGRQDLGGK